MTQTNSSDDIHRQGRPLLSHRLIVNIGKGGVGKSAVSAAMALAASRRGLKTLLVQLDAKDRISEYLGTAPVEGDVKEYLPGLYCVNIFPRDAQREYVLHLLKFGAIYKVVFENRLVRAFINGVPAINDLMMLSKVDYHLSQKHWGGAWVYDVVIIDAPPTGHGMFFLSVPDVIIQALSRGPLHQSAMSMARRLRDPSYTAFNLISLPEEMPVSETIDAYNTLVHNLGMTPTMLTVNRYLPGQCAGIDPGVVARARDRAGNDTPLPEALRVLAEEVRRYGQAREHIERLVETLHLPEVYVEDMISHRFGRDEIEAIARAMEVRL